ncbi:site-specific DNA-methyltransferase [Acidithiobacillus thiooxidans]|uniref:DNA-methyltransferase n=1 Tax=Acidithiobacillus thiooxidans TaxID=930 RepID=UPI0013012579|nr:site-specific DNA-methyltransferase [Acidithiobacillus thiooxidans]MBU2836967.1 site-specific DNA-methyltransferase [Acidithiobacillus thiooxidans]
MALQADGWFLRSDIVWVKPNAMPESVKDRPTRSHEMVFLLSKSQRYFYDHIAVQEPTVSLQSAQAGSFRRVGSKREQCIPGQSAGTHRPNRKDTVFANSMRNQRDVWNVSTKPFHGAHFAVFPPGLVDPMIRAGTSEKGVCPTCGTPWVRKNGSSFYRGKANAAREVLAKVETGPRAITLRTDGWQPGCQCDAADPIPAVVLDPFGGSGTVAIVAESLGRDWRIIEANPEYAAMATARIQENREWLIRNRIYHKPLLQRQQLKMFS